jgi:putative SOS response-associated peptidase YedK
MPHNRALTTLEPLAAIFPGHMAPVVRRASDGERELSMLSWGFVLPQNGKAPRRVTNVRDGDSASGKTQNSPLRIMLIRLMRPQNLPGHH